MKMSGAVAEIHDALRPETAAIAGTGDACGADVGTDPAFGGPHLNDSLDGDLGQAIEAKKHDNLVLGEALVSFGLLQRYEMSELQSAQAGSDDVVGSLMVASAIRSRLGDILLQAKRITSSQLELALEMQRRRGGLLGEVMVGMGMLDRGTLDAALALQAGRAPAC
jgi:hypothetical protein